MKIKKPQNKFKNDFAGALQPSPWPPGRARALGRGRRANEQMGGRTSSILCEFYFVRILFCASSILCEFYSFACSRTLPFSVFCLFHIQFLFTVCIK